MSSTVSPFSITALNQQTNAVRSLIPALEKVNKSNGQLANACLVTTKATERAPVEFKSTLDKLEGVLRKSLSALVVDWGKGQQAAWNTYTDSEARAKGVQGVIGKAVQGTEDYLYTALFRKKLASQPDADGNITSEKVKPKFRDQIADPVLNELRGVLVRESLIGISGAVAKSEWWQAFTTWLSPTPKKGRKISPTRADAGAGTEDEATKDPSVWTTGAMAGWDEYLAKAGGIAGMVETLFNDSLNNTQNYLVSVMTDGKLSFRTLADSVISDVSRVAARMAVSGLGQLFSTGAQMFASSGWGSSILSFFQADGGAWNQGVQMYAKGGAFRHGVVNSPTFFGAAGGRLGVMGEAGPEAIMPLARTADGALGVRTLGGSGTTVQIHAPVTVAIGDRGADGSQIDQQALTGNLQRQLQAAAERAVAESWRPGGVSYRNAMGRG